MRGEVVWTRARRDVPPLPPLAANAEVDVVIVGGGIVGLAAARLLAENRRVMLLEAARIGGGATGRSTAKATSQHGPIYRSLVQDIGEAGARAYAQANEAAIGWIADVARAGDGDAFTRADAFVFARDADEADGLHEEAQVAARLGLPADLAAEAEIGLPHAGVLRFTNQGSINPSILLRDLAASLRGRAALHEGTRVVAVEHGEPCVVRTTTATVKARWVIVATQIPIVPEGRFFARVFPHAHAVVAARQDRLANGIMAISAGEPTRSFHTARVAGEDWLVATGEPFRPGDAGTQAAAFATLAAFLHESFGLAPELGWVNEDFRPMDGLPFVGPATGATPNLLVATGFDAWGITTGVVAGHVLAAIIEGREHPLAPVLDAARLRPLKGGSTFFTENARTGLRMVRDRAFGGRVADADAIRPGEGGVIRHRGQQVALSRDESGRPTAVSAICTHFGCVVGWNGVDRTWDCPCHGSRFSASGEVLCGPAVAPLEPVDLDAGPES